ncbi:MAG: hypothetical protein AABZ01_12300, partial [Gemmatimonadota bacterium]
MDTPLWLFEGRARALGASSAGDPPIQEDLGFTSRHGMTTTPHPLATADAIVVLGCKVLDDGSPSPALARRLAL